MITVEKPKLPRHLAYVLKTSLLDRALSEAGIDCDLHLLYWTPQSGGSILEAFYWLPNERFDHVRVYVRAGSVASNERRAAVAQLREQAVPALVAWLHALRALPENSPVLSQELRFNATWDGRHVTVDATPPIGR